MIDCAVKYDLRLRLASLPYDGKREWNVVVGEHDDRDVRLIFGPEVVSVVQEPVTMIDLLAQIGAFESKSQARKNWRGPVEIPLGFTDWIVGKGKNLKWLSVWKPLVSPHAEPINRG